MSTYAKVTIKKFIDSPELDMDEFIRQHSEPTGHRNVRFYIVFADPDHNRPIVREYWYFVGTFYYSQVCRLHNKPAVSWGNGRYSVDGLPTLITGEVRQEEREVPRPKCRVPVEWQAGRWMKYLRSKGWVVA